VCSISYFSKTGHLVDHAETVLTTTRSGYLLKSTQEAGCDSVTHTYRENNYDLPQQVILCSHVEYRRCHVLFATHCSTQDVHIYPWTRLADMLLDWESMGLDAQIQEL
jgi:hypothetical protein